MPPDDTGSFRASQFDQSRLFDSKQERTISVCIPARNEESTVASIVSTIRDSLMSGRESGGSAGLVDEVIVMDDSSTDRTAEVAREAGAVVVPVSEVLPECGPGAGKGNVLWKSVASSSGDIIVWIDADLTSFTASYVVGLVGPLLIDDSIEMVKGFYDRPEVAGAGGGRTTEIMARPLISTFFPELAMIRQPLGGEYAARRSVLECLPFFHGYGVETGLLIDISRRSGAESIAQVDLGIRHHRVRPLQDLTVQSMEVLHTALHRAGGIDWNPDWSTVLARPDHGPVNVETAQRPPLISCEGYRGRLQGSGPNLSGEATTTPGHS